MFRRILVPTDFSTASEWVFDDAIRIAADYDAEIVILHVRMTWTDDPGSLRFPADPSLYEYAERQELDRLRERLKRMNASVATRLIVKQAPDPGAQISLSAREEGVDLIIIPTHARHHVAHLLVGSTALSVVSNPPTPVLAIRYGIRKRAALKRVLIPAHLGQTSTPALDLAAGLGLEVHLLTVCPEHDEEHAAAFLHALAERIEGATTAIVRGKDPEEEIVRFAAKIDADAILLNAGGEPGPRKVDIIRHATVPVMIVPPRSPASEALS